MFVRVVVVGALADLAELPQPTSARAIAPAQNEAERDTRAA
jgi:hypothetical protein